MAVFTKMNCSNTNYMLHSYKDIIPVFLADFKKDFDCKDIEEILRTILKNKEVDDIVKASQPMQVYRLFWTLRDQQKEIVEKFVEEGLKDMDYPNYGFLMSAIQQECRDPSLNTENYITEVDRLYNENQKFAKYNVPRIEPHLELQNALLKLKPSKNVVVEGVLGAGKQWLALDVCLSYVVQRKMDFKIFWFNVGSCFSAESQLKELQSFLLQIAPALNANCDHSMLLNIEWVRTHIRHRLKDKSYKNCLLVLRNVQNKETWETFNLGCKILLTTRNKSVVNFLSSKTTTHITLNDTLNLSEVESLFEKYLCDNLPESLLELAVSVTYDHKTNPLYLSIIAENIRDGLYSLNNWKQIKSDKLTNIIKNSLSVLEPNDRQLYEDLFIFPAFAHIPIDLLGIVWSINQPMIVVNKLKKYSLVKIHSENQTLRTITIPGIYRELNLPIDNEAALNKKVADYYNLLFEQSDDLTISHLDNYFFSHIGFHLCKLRDNVERGKLFRKIFLDFRFLEQKIRNDITRRDARGSVQNTLKALKFYKNEIAENMRDYENLINNLLVFLRTAEEKIIRSKFTCLLQLALMSKDCAVYDEARRQAQRFPDYIWFTERGRYHQHRQIINLGKDEVQHAIYLPNDFCLMALNTRQLLLTDVSLGGDTTYLFSDDNDPCDIIEMRVFNNQLHLLTLHSNGSLKLWSLRKLFGRRHNCGIDSAVMPQIAPVPPYSKSLCYEQLINNAVERSGSTHVKQNKISSFFLDEKYIDDIIFIQLHVAFSNGDICICDWEFKEEKFKKSYTPILSTRQDQLRCFTKMLDRFYVLCTVDCKITVWDLCCGSKEAERVFYNDKALAMESYIEQLSDGRTYTMILLIFKTTVWQLKFKHTDFNANNILRDALQFSNIGATPISCGRLSKDGCYLVLGTLEGLIVYDLKHSYTVLRNNISEHIVCLDIYDLNGSEKKYIIVCGAAGKSFLHLHTLRNGSSIDNCAIAWDYNEGSHALQLGTMPNSQANLESNEYLRPFLKMSDDGTLFTVDSKSHIYTIQAGVGQNHNSTYWATIRMPQMEENMQITALCVCKNNTIFAGYNNGEIFNISENKRILHLSSRIDYLKSINSNEIKSILVASSRLTNYTFIFSLSTRDIDYPNLKIYTKYAQLFKERFLFLFSALGVYYIDLFTHETKQIAKPHGLLVAFDLKGNLLFLASKDNTIKVYELDYTANKLNYQVFCKENIKCQHIIIRLTVSNDGQILSIGFRNGHIWIYTCYISGLQLVHTIKQGHEPCSEMKLRFSPCKQILVSCADLLCFWNVKHMLNNRTINYRPSGRHNHKQSRCQPSGCEEVDASPWTNASVDVKYAKESKAYLWMDKRGNTKLPVLLASIKYVGNVARNFYTSVDFTNFFAIDDEGVFYDLKVLEHLGHHKDVIPDQQPLNVVDYATIINQTEEIIPPVTDENGQDNGGIDVVGNFISEMHSRTDDHSNVI